MNKYDILISELNTRLQKISTKESEIDSKNLKAQEELSLLIKDKEKLELEIKELSHIKELLINYNPQKLIKEFLHNLPAHLTVLFLINILIISIFKVSSLPILIILNCIISFASLFEDYFPRFSTLKILSHNNLNSTQEKLNELTKNLKNIDKKIVSKEKEAQNYETISFKIYQEYQELTEKLNLILNKKNTIINTILNTKINSIEAEINAIYDQDDTLKLIKVK